MTKRLLILSLLFARVITLSWSQDANKDNQLRNLVIEYRQAEVTIPYPGSVVMDILTKTVQLLQVRAKRVSIIF